MFVIPKNADKGKVVVDPQRMDTIPAEGRDVGVDHPEYWERRRMDGDIDVITDPDKIQAAKADAAVAEAKRNSEAGKAREEAQKAEAQKQVETPAPQAKK